MRVLITVVVVAVCIGCASLAWRDTDTTSDRTKKGIQRALLVVPTLGASEIFISRNRHAELREERNAELATRREGVAEAHQKAVEATDESERERWDLEHRIRLLEYEALERKPL